MSATSDPIADILTMLRNDINAEHINVDVHYSKIKPSIAKILKDEGFIKNFKMIEDNKQKVLRIYLKYSEENQPAILELKMISKPGRRIYTKAEELKPVYNNIGIWILSTPKGVLTNKAAKKLNVGGEVICEIS